MNYEALVQAIEAYTENYETSFVANIPVFLQQSETRIYNSVQIPALRKNVIGTLTSGNKYLSCPNDYLSSFSLAVINTDTSYSYLLNKDVNFIRESYPMPTDTGVPGYYALFGTQLTYPNELSFILGPTPDAGYDVELHYYYYPPTIVQGQISGFGTITAGSGYTNGTYLNIALTGGNGSGSTAADITIAGGVVTSVSLNYGGSNYIVGNVLTASNTLLGGTGSGFSIPVATVSNASGTSWLGDNMDTVLLYGALREAYLFMKGEADLIANVEQKFQEAMGQLNRLGSGLERGDAYRDGQYRIGQVKP